MRFGFQSSRWLLLIVCLLACFVDALLYSILLPLLPIYKQQFDVSNAFIGIFLSLMSFSQLFASFPVGYLVWRLGVRSVFLLGVITLLSSTIIYAISRSFFLLFVSRIIQGFSAAATWTASISAVPHAFASSQQGKVMGALNIAAGMGMLCGPPLGGFIYNQFQSVSAPFWFVTAIISIDALLRLLYVDKEKEEKNATHRVEDIDVDVSLLSMDALEDEGEEQESVTVTMAATTTSSTSKIGFTAYLALLKHPIILSLNIIAFATSFSFGAIEPLVPLYLSSVYIDISPLEIGAIFLSLPLSFTLASIISGYVGDRYEFYRSPLCIVGLVFVAIALALMAFVRSLYLFIPLLCVFGIASAFPCSNDMPLINAKIDVDFSKEYYGVAAGLQNSFWCLGAFTAPIFFGAISNAGDYNYAGLSSGVVVLLLTIIASTNVFRQLPSIFL